jgi:hypothetical protein
LNVHGREASRNRGPRIRAARQQRSVLPLGRAIQARSTTCARKASRSSSAPSSGSGGRRRRERVLPRPGRNPARADLVRLSFATIRRRPQGRTSYEQDH